MRQQKINLAIETSKFQLNQVVNQTYLSNQRNKVTAESAKAQLLFTTQLLTFSLIRLLRPAPWGLATMLLFVRVLVPNEIMLIVSIQDKLLVCLNILFKCYLFQLRPLMSKPKEWIFARKVSPTETGYQMFSINRCVLSPVLIHPEGQGKRKNQLTKGKTFRIDRVKEKDCLRLTKMKVKTYKTKQNQELTYFVPETLIFICLLNTLMKKCANKCSTEKFKTKSSALNQETVLNS